MDESTQPGDESTNAPPAPEQDNVAPTQAGTPPPAETPATEPTPSDAVPPPPIDQAAKTEDQTGETADEQALAPEPSEAHRVLLEIESRLHHLELLPSVTAQWFRDKLAELKRHL